MGRCEICRNETDDSETIYQADLVGSQRNTSRSGDLFGDTYTTTTVKTYRNVMLRTYYCCKECRSEKGLWKGYLICTVVGIAGGTVLSWFDVREAGGFVLFLYAIGMFVFVLILAIGFFVATISNLIYPYRGKEDTLIEHLSKPGNNGGHVYMTKADGNKLQRQY